VPPTNHRHSRGLLVTDRLLRRLGEELRAGRVSAGLSQNALGRSAGMSGAQVSRLEHARSPRAPVRVFAVLFASLGQTLTMRAYPDGSPLRDAGHVRLLRRFAATLPPTARLRTEVPLQRRGDRRAWDGELLLGDGRCKVEAETVVADAQALDRRIALKMADDCVDDVILLVSDTRRNRAALRESGDLLRARFPLPAREIRAALAQGRCPPAGGILVM
jgi:transcriptional regulator with XRE-family HTH domain